jgi:hypothetical protein
MAITVNGTNNTVVFPGTTSGQITLQATPASATHVQYLPDASGTLLLSNVTMIFPTTLGLPGEVLTTDGAGNLYWGVGGGGGGSVTSVNAATVAGMGLSFSGGPILNAGTLTLGGTLSIANGGTGATSASAALNNLLPTQTGQSGNFLTTDGAGGVTWAPAGGGGGLVTSVGFDPTTTGFTINGSTAPFTITSSGVFTLGGILDIAHGGTGLNTVGPAGEVLISNGTAAGWGAIPPVGDLSGGVAGSVPYQSAANTTGFVPPGTAGQVLQSNGAGAPTWVNAPAAASLVGGAASQVLYQSAANTTSFVPNGTSGQSLLSNGLGAPAWGAVNIASSAAITGVLPIANGGTGLNAVGPSGEILLSNGTSAAWAAIPPAADIANGGPGQLPYQTAADTTAFVPAGTAGQILQSNGTSAPTWINVPNAPAISGGIASQVLYQSSPGVTSFVPNGTTGQSLLSNGVGAPAWGPINLALAGAVTGTLPVANGGTGITALGAGVQAALGNATNSAGGFPVLNVSGILPISQGGTGLGTIGTANQVLTSDGTNAVWANASSLASSLTGGIASQIPYQSAPNTTSFIPNGTSGQFLKSNGLAAPSWTSGFVTLGTTTVPLNGSTLTLGGLTTVTLTQDPVNPLEAATKQYVDLASSSVNRVAPVDCATTIGITLSNAPQTIDGVTVNGGERVLVKNQVATQDNGIYDVVAVGAWTRAADADTWNEYVAAQVYVLNGTTQDATSWIQTSPAGGTLGVTPILWEQTSGVNSYAAGTGLSQAGNVFSNAGVLSFSGGGTGLTPSIPTTGAISLGGILAVANGGTGLSALGAGVVTALGNAAGGANGFALLNASGILPIAQGGTGLSALGTGVQTALGNAVGTAGGFITVGATPLTQHGVVVAGASGALNSTVVGTNGQVLIGQTGADPVWSSGPTLGVQGTTAGFLRLANTNVGAFPTTIQSSNSATMAWTLTLPPDDGTAGYVLATDGSGNTTWVNKSALGFTQGSVPFVGPSGDFVEDNTNFFFDNVANQLSIGTNVTATVPADIQLQVAKDALIAGMTVGLGKGQVATNTAVGNTALDVNTIGANLTAIGVAALSSNTTGSDNTALGAGSLLSNAGGNSNTASGVASLQNNTGGDQNAAFGMAALGGNLTGDNNVAVGYNSLSANTIGGQNTAIGANAGSAVTGSNNTLIGAYTGATAPISASGSNYIVLSDGAANVAAYWTGLNGNLTNKGTISTGVVSTSQGALILNNTTAFPTTVKSSNSATAAWTLTLPVDDGAAGQALITDGAGVTSWGAAGATITDTTTAGTNYPVFANANTGTFSTAYVTSTKYTFNPGTGQLTAPNMASSQGIHLNANAITANYTLPANYNGMSAGPISVAAGVTVTVGAGAAWSVV